MQSVCLLHYIIMCHIHLALESCFVNLHWVFIALNLFFNVMSSISLLSGIKRIKEILKWDVVLTGPCIPNYDATIIILAGTLHYNVKAPRCLTKLKWYWLKVRELPEKLSSPLFTREHEQSSHWIERIMSVWLLSLHVFDL